MKNTLICLAFIFTLNLCAQDTLFYDIDWKETESLKKAEYYTIIIKDISDTNKVEERSYFKSQQIRQIIYYSSYNKYIRTGTSKTWYRTGKLKEEATSSENKLNGKLQTFWDNGQIKRDDTYNMGKLIDGKIYNSDGTQVPYYDYEIAAQYPGGINELVRYLSTKIKYPKKARRQNISGKVILKFYVDTDGSIQNITVKQSVSEELDKEAIRVVKKMPKWDPAIFDGSKVKSYYLLPISFKFT